MTEHDVCEICHKPITGCFVGTGTGFAHDYCYERTHQPTIAHSLYEVARGHADPVIAADVINGLVPEDLAAAIVKTYNRRLLLAWQRRCEET